MITSVQNPLIKNILKLQKSSVRKNEGLFLIEGLEEVKMALNNFTLEKLLFCPHFFQKEEETFLNEVKKIPLQMCSEAVFRKISYRENPDGILGVAKSQYLKLDDLKIGSKSFFLIAEGIEKPGNLGALLRSADGAGASGVIVVDEGVDIYNPNVIRASRGALFCQNIVVEKQDQVLEWLRKNGIKIVAATPVAKIAYTDLAPLEKCAFIVGREHEGLTPFWKSHADYLVNIPMRGHIDSLNVSVAAALLLFEAARWNNLA